MSKIDRAEGTTSSERYLAKLAERSFLDLWSYPNVFADRRSNGGRSDGKEICDLLVVCGEHVIVFSDKTISWPEAADIDLSWSRWYKRAIKKSADQVNGALRWLTDFPNRVFLDAACTKPFPIELPPIDRRKVHGIVVALGALEAVRKHFSNGSGSLRVVPRLSGSDHTNKESADYAPLSIGDINPNGPFVHVFDEVILDVILQELDTISDFSDYLDRKANFVPSGHLHGADGEEDLLAYYLVHTDGDRNHAFVRPDGKAWAEGDRLAIEPGTYASMREHPLYIAKKKADKISYLWDNLILAFTKNIIGGTLAETPEWANVPIEGGHEMGVRYMALEDRTQRRAYGQAIADAMFGQRKSDRFARGLIPPPERLNHETGYVFMLLAVPDGGDITYKRYREVRSSILYGYVINTLRRNRHLSRVIGIATEPLADAEGPRGSSEDLVYMEMPTWTSSEIEEAERFAEHYGIFRETTLEEYQVRTEEYPEVRGGVGSHQNSIPYDYRHPDRSPDELEAATIRRKRRSAFRAHLLSGDI